MSATLTDKIILIFCVSAKTMAKKILPPLFVASVILDHSQGKFVI